MRKEAQNHKLVKHEKKLKEQLKYEDARFQKINASFNIVKSTLTALLQTQEPASTVALTLDSATMNTITALQEKLQTEKLQRQLLIFGFISQTAQHEAKMKEHELAQAKTELELQKQQNKALNKEKEAVGSLASTSQISQAETHLHVQLPPVLDMPDLPSTHEEEQFGTPLEIISDRGPGMEASNVPISSNQGAQVFTLDALGMSSQAKSTPPRIKVDKTFELTKGDGVTWFVDTYNMDANYKDDIHLYLSQGDMKYGDMGMVVSVKDDVDATAMPCFACNVLPVGETTKANKFCLLLDSFHVANMNGSKLGKENSIVKLRLNISSFTNQEDSGVDFVEDLVKAVKHAKRTLSLPKRDLPGKKPMVVPSKKDVEKTGKKPMAPAARLKAPAECSSFLREGWSRVVTAQQQKKGTETYACN
ncbi:hypothetical protein L7F22_025314 [Adiantum nelumboides]|nr:hypothetical protein [Adiantum nelumboides]